MATKKGGKKSAKTGGSKKTRKGGTKKAAKKSPYAGFGSAYKSFSS